MWIVLFKWLLIISTIYLIFRLILVPRVNKISVQLIKKEVKGEIFMLIYSVDAGAPGANDVVERKMTITVNDNVVDTKSYKGDVVDLGELGFEEQDKVSLSLVDVDNVGNVSPAAIFEFVAVDTIAPPAPGSFGVKLVREE